MSCFGRFLIHGQVKWIQFFAKARPSYTLTVAFAYEQAVLALVSITTKALPLADALADA
jgi:hypothetical protein